MEWSTETVRFIFTGGRYLNLSIGYHLTSYGVTLLTMLMVVVVVGVVVVVVVTMSRVS